MKLFAAVAVAAGMLVAWWMSFVREWCDRDRHVGRGYLHE